MQHVYPTTITWTSFQSNFPSVYQDMNQFDFLRLVQEPMSIVEYGQKFTDLSRYVSQLVEV